MISAPVVLFLILFTNTAALVCVATVTAAYLRKANYLPVPVHYAETAIVLIWFVPVPVVLVVIVMAHVVLVFASPLIGMGMAIASIAAFYYAHQVMIAPRKVRA